MLKKQLEPRFWHKISSKRGVGGCLTNTICAKQKKRQVIIFSYIVWKLTFCGNWFLLFLIYSGLCTLRWEGYSSVGATPLLAKKGKRLGKLFLFAFFGPFRGREMGESLRIVKAWTKQLKVLFCFFFGIGLDYTLGMILCRY